MPREREKQSKRGMTGQRREREEKYEKVEEVEEPAQIEIFIHMFTERERERRGNVLIPLSLFLPYEF